MGKKSGSPQGDTKSAELRSREDSGAESEATAEPVAPQAPRLPTVDEWAARMFPRSRKGRQHPGLYKHAVAAQRHGWALYEHHNGGQPMRLSEEDYLAALECALRSKPPAPQGDEPPKADPRVHPPALFQLNPQER